MISKVLWANARYVLGSVVFGIAWAVEQIFDSLRNESEITRRMRSYR